MEPEMACIGASAGIATAAMLLLVSAAAGQQAPSCPEPPREDTAAITTVRYLADDRLEGRLAGSAGERCAGDYIAARFRRAGLEPAGEDGGFFQELPLASALNPHSPAGTGRNVIGLLRGASALPNEPVIVIGAHYDHLGMGEFGSLSPAEKAVHNGADDNASGVAAMLRAAELLAAERPGRSIVFIAFTGEESGLLGSAYFVNRGTLPIGRLRAMINLDMVGRLGDGPLIVSGVGTATEWRGILDEVAAAEDVAMAYQTDGFGPSDHTSFYARDVPVLHFFTNTHSDYHKPSDDWERIDARGLNKVAAVVARVTRTLARPDQLLTLQRGAGAPPAPRSGGSRAYLGSVPDFTPVERGVLLGGVGPGSPAEQAGIRAGDIIVGLGEHDVADLQGLTDALTAHKPGDEVRVRLLRDGGERSVTVILGTRGGR